MDAALAFHRLEGPPLKKHVREVVAQVAERLGNTAAICRKCYIHPDIIAAYEAGELSLGRHIDKDDDDETALDRAERATLRFLKSRLPA